MLSRFLRYADGQYGLREELAGIRDHRHHEQGVKTFAVVAGLFFMACVQTGSLNRIEEALGRCPLSCRWRRWIGGALPSADRLGEVAEKLDLDDLRGRLQGHYRRRRRKKTLHPFADGRYMLILDGHEFAASFCRSCPECTQRRVRRGKEKHIQYYHRYVLAYLVGRNGRVVLDLEMQQAHEGEIVAARRLVERLLRVCPRAFDVVGGDALYLDPKLCRDLVDAGKDFIAVLKNKNRDLIQDFNGLRDRVAVKKIQCHGHTCACRDIEGFTSWTSFGRPVRVVSSEETRLVRDPKTRTKVPVTSTWMWATTLSAAQMSTTELVHLGHRRWDIENYAFNELDKYWHADHVYHHHAHAMTAILLILMLAYNLFHVWQARGIKPALRDRYAVYFFAELLKSAFYSGLQIAVEALPP